LAGAIIIAIPVGVRCLLADGTLPLYLGLRWAGASVISWALTGQAGLPSGASHGWPSAGFAFFAYFLGAVAFGLISLISNSFLSPDSQARRKAHVMLWGTIIGITPVCLVAVTAFGGFATLPLAVWQVSVLLLLSVWPLSFAYAVVKHRVLEIPVLLRRSARYVLVQRGYLFLLFLVAATVIVLLTKTISRSFAAGTNISMAISAVFGIVLARASAPVVKRGTERIDRAFFRSAYDARLILQDLAEAARAMTDRQQLAKLPQEKIQGALHPKSLACYFEAGDRRLVSVCHSETDEFDRVTSSIPPHQSPFGFGAPSVPQESDEIPANLPLLRGLAQHGKAWDVPSAEASNDSALLAPECMVPILGRKNRLLGLLLLGQRLSEEPYSTGRQAVARFGSESGRCHLGKYSARRRDRGASASRTAYRHRDGHCSSGPGQNVSPEVAAAQDT
jgi:sigma-B regulation protein RsbU (phosphoserine phosphatase)